MSEHKRDRMDRVITIRLEEPLYQDLKQAGVDMSKVCREALERALYRLSRSKLKGSA